MPSYLYEQTTTTCGTLLPPNLATNVPVFIWNLCHPSLFWRDPAVPSSGFLLLYLLIETKLTTEHGAGSAGSESPFLPRLFSPRPLAQSRRGRDREPVPGPALRTSRVFLPLAGVGDVCSSAGRVRDAPRQSSCLDASQPQPASAQRLTGHLRNGGRRPSAQGPRARATLEMTPTLKCPTDSFSKGNQWAVGIRMSGSLCAGLLWGQLRATVSVPRVCVYVCARTRACVQAVPRGVEPWETGEITLRIWAKG